ncbi:hypothetical protein [Amycolatopsis sp. NPDC051128]|uniref:hypothetical protein n=1 Tax=Amycolatopsis sp. NPDC051128 TaxID=3155412 RepID=UPI003449AF2A
MPRRGTVLIRPELDDEALHRTLAQVRPGRQLHGLGADHGRALWQPAARLLRATGPDWDRRAHRVSVLAAALPPATTERWCADRPRDPDALVVRAGLDAWHTITTGRTSEAAAGRSCRQAAEAWPEDPTPWLALLSVRCALGSAERHVRPIWHEVVARDPGNRAAHHEFLRYLSPRRHGSLLAMTDFARTCGRNSSPLAILPLAGRVEQFAWNAHRGDAGVLGARLRWHEEDIADELDHAIAGLFHAGTPSHAAAVADLNILAFVLTRTRRTTDAAPIFRRLGGHMTRYPWNLTRYPVDAYTYWREQAYRQPRPGTIKRPHEIAPRAFRSAGRGLSRDRLWRASGGGLSEEDAVAQESFESFGGAEAVDSVDVHLPRR